MDFQSHNNTSGNKFVCPSDRQLALRAKLRAGWSSSKTNEPLRPDEQAAIISVIRRNEEIETAERQRVGRLVERVEKIKQRAVEGGPNCCRLCGDTFGLLRSTRIICEDCKKSVCAKCSVDINIRYHTSDRTREIWLCRICSETREMWKKSGAWFFKGLPNYDAPSSTNSTPTHQSASGGAMSDVLLPPRGAQSCNNTPTRNVRVKKLTIHVDDSSSSEEDTNGGGGGGGDVVDGAISAVCVAAPLTTARTPNRNSFNADVSPPAATRMQREDSFRLRTFGSIRSFIDSGERKLSNSFFANRQSSRTESSQQDYDTISTASTVTSVNNRRESNCNYTRRSSVSSSWSISGESSSGNSANTSNHVPNHNQVNLHCRELLGWLEVAVSYRESVHSLDCVMVRARDLPAMDAAGLTDPYCKVNLVTPDGMTKYSRWLRTKTVHKTRNPEFNETLQFVGVEPEELGGSSLYVAIFDDDKYGHDYLGGAKISLSPVHNTNQYRISVPLGGEDRFSNEAEMSQEWPHGKILISLCYNTKRRALVVNVKQCINLIPMDNNGSSDPFVKLQLKPDSHKNKKYKTGVKWRTLNPIYREEFYFESSPHDLNKQTLYITVWDKDIGKSNDFLGSLVIGYNSKGERLQQWLDCIKLPDHFHEKWHCLSGEHPTH
ncbi:rabphilin-3A [Bactrocera tryoni]|uniref:rabphilin-3A n=1 Tax=Bactrocera tryoni TaxID=59916 RepID=UPI001A9912BF|nr:rabphilin-3A [Bactrocera tryoni]XP_039959255.1 rabphilin-3A [Bactrocera tryoni]XP_039959256.1 rabphilin-3A [Bactrocera tryoni]XP_039959257.1 rabphilin-3A [Bactrocera tryoni]